MPTYCSSYTKRQTNQIKQSLSWIRYQVTNSIGTVSYTSLTHCIKSHATFSAADSFQKILHNKSEISFSNIYFNQTRVLEPNRLQSPRKIFRSRPKQNQLYVYSCISISATSPKDFAPPPTLTSKHLLLLAGLASTFVGSILFVYVAFFQHSTLLWKV